MIKQSITDVIRNILSNSGEFESVKYIGDHTIEIKKDGVFYNMRLGGSLANLFG